MARRNLGPSMSGSPDAGPRTSTLQPICLSTFNVRGLTATYKKNALANDLTRHGVDFCCLQETKVTKAAELKVDKYELFLLPSTQRSYGLGFAVSNRFLSFVHRHWAVNDRIAVMTLRFPLASRGGRLMVHLINCYGPTSALTDKNPELSEQFFDQLSKTVYELKNSHSIIFVGGDFNSRAGRKVDGESSMGSHGRGYRNSNGDELVHFAESCGFFLANTTFQHPHRHRTTWECAFRTGRKVFNQIDYLLVPQEMKSFLRQARSYAGLQTDSDHRLVACLIDLKGIHIQWAKLRQKSWRLAVRDLREQKEKFAATCDVLFSSQSSASSSSLSALAAPADSLCPAPSLSPSCALTQLQGTLLQAAETIVGRIEPRKRTNDPEIVALSEQQREIREKMRATPDADALAALRDRRRELMKKLHKLTRAKAIMRIDAQVAEIEEVKNDAQMFRAVQALRCVDRSPLVITDNDGKFVSTAQEKANEASQFFRMQFLCENKPKMEAFTGPPSPLNSPITVDEVATAINKLRCNRATGPDGVPAECFKFSGRHTAEKMAKIFNDVFARHESIETNFGTIIPLAKPGKPKGPCTSLRPVTLLNCVRKILSLIVLGRIRPKVEADLPSYQAGFRPGRSTTDAVLAKRWLCAIVERFNITIFYLGLDLTRAFDTIDRDLLIEWMEDDPKLSLDDCRMVRYLLANTTLCVRVGDVSSPPFDSNMGSPQGDGLSPFIFIYYLNRAMRRAHAALPPLCIRPRLDVSLNLPEYSAYADDLDLISTSKEYLEAKFDTIETTFKTCNLLVNRSKTERVCIEIRPSSDCCPKCQVKCQSNAICCDVCTFWWHFSCAELSLSQIREMEKNPKSVFACPLCVKGERPVHRGKEKWRTTKSLGSLLGDPEDIKNRMCLAAAAFRQHVKIWPRRHLASLRRRMRIYNVFVLPVLCYNLGATALTKQTAAKLDAFHRRQLRHIVGIFWPNTISNTELYRITNSTPISQVARGRRWALFGHVLRLPPDTQASLAMKAYFNAPLFLSRRSGRSRTCLPDVLEQDLDETFELHKRALKTPGDFEALRRLAKNRDGWRRFLLSVVEES